MVKDKATDLPVEFGGVSIGQQTAKLSIKINREFLNIVAADDALCGRRVTGKVAFGRSGDTPGQMLLLEEMDEVIEATFDIHRFGVTPDHFTSGLTFKLKEIDIGQLARFSKGSGRLVLDEVEEIPRDAVDDSEDAEEVDGQTTMEGTFRTDGPWRKVALDTLFSGAVLKSLKAAGLATVGDLHDYQQPDKKSGYVKQLTDIKGIGESKVQQIEDRMMEFWRDNKQEDSE